MPKKDDADVLAEIRRDGPRPVYLIDGEERFLVDEAVRTIKERSLDKKSRDFNFDTYTGKEAKLVKILDTARTFPAFAARRLVIVEQADKLDLEESEPLVRYLADPCPTTTLVFVGERFDARTKTYKAFQKSAVVIRFNRPREREMPDLIRGRARAMGLKIEEPAVRALVNAVGADAGAAIQALELLSLYVGPGAAIAPKDVDALISGSREESIFALADAIGNRDKAAAFRGLHALFEVSREHPLRVLAMIARHWRNLLRARSLIDAGSARQEIERAVGVPPYFLDGLLAQARKRPAASFAEGLLAISEVDEALKGGPLDDARAMERLVLGLMR